MAFTGEIARYPSQPPFTEGPRSPHPTGILIAIGGEADESTLSQVVGSVTNGGRLFVATLASREPDESYEHNSGAMVGLGVDSSHIKTQSELIASLGQMDNKSTLFLGGGNQEFLMNELKNSGQDQLRQAHKRGITIAGTSAGAMVMGDVTPMEDENGVLKIINGLKLIPGIAIDTHVKERDRISRLRWIVRQRGVLGIGFDERTGGVIRETKDGKELEVIGNGGVHIVHSGGEVDLTQGDRFHLGKRVVLQRQN